MHIILKVCGKTETFLLEELTAQNLFVLFLFIFFYYY